MANLLAILILNSLGPLESSFRYSKALPQIASLPARYHFQGATRLLVSGNLKWITIDREEHTPRYSLVYDVDRQMWIEYSFRSAYDGKQYIYGNHNAMNRYFVEAKKSSPTARMFHYQALVNCAGPTRFYVMHNVWSASPNKGQTNPNFLIFEQDLVDKINFVEPNLKVFGTALRESSGAEWYHPKHFEALSSDTFIVNMSVIIRGGKPKHLEGFALLTKVNQVKPLWTEENMYNEFAIARWPDVSKHPIVVNHINQKEVVLREVNGTKVKVISRKVFATKDWIIERAEPYREFLVIMLKPNTVAEWDTPRLLFCHPKTLEVKGELSGEYLSGVSPDARSMILVTAKKPYEGRIVSGPVTFSTSN